MEILVVRMNQGVLLYVGHLNMQRGRGSWRPDIGGGIANSDPIEQTPAIVEVRLNEL